MIMAQESCRSNTNCEDLYLCYSYRLNVFGFPNARGLKDGERNVGLLDLRQG